MNKTFHPHKSRLVSPKYDTQKFLNFSVLIHFFPLDSKFFKLSVFIQSIIHHFHDDIYVKSSSNEHYIKCVSQLSGKPCNTIIDDKSIIEFPLASLNYYTPFFP